MVDIESVVVEPDHCYRCGTAVGTTEWEGREHPWCPACDLILSRHPAPGVHIVVHTDETVLVLDEPIPQHEGLWSLPGGYAKHDEGPRETGLRELEEETGLRADPDDLRFLTIVHAEFPKHSLYLITYGLDAARTSGEVTPEAEGFEAMFRSLDELRASSNRLRASDQERIELALEGGN